MMFMLEEVVVMHKNQVGKYKYRWCHQSTVGTIQAAL